MNKNLKKLVVSTVAVLMFSANVYGYTDDYAHRSNMSFIEKIGVMLGFNDSKNESASHDFSMYDDVYYYEADNLSRYTKFSAKNPDIAPEDVIWLVNANVDRKFYDKSQKIKDTDEDILLVNKYNYLPNNYEPENLVEISSGKFATDKTAKAFMEMQENAKSEGIEINLISAYRSIDYQKDLYKKYVKKDGKELADTYSARAGYSEHHTGRALDIASTDMSIENFGSTEASRWVNENAWKYGFIVRYTAENSYITGYKAEPWHITYVGTDIAERMKKYDIGSLEEYFVKYIDHNPYGYSE